MATIQKRGQSYSIRVSCGYDVDGKQVIQSKTWKPDAGMSERQIEKELNRQAVMFEENCLKGQVTACVKFQELAEEWLENYVKVNLKNSTICRYQCVKPRVYAAFGHLRIDKINARQIQSFITDLAVNGRNLQNGKPIGRKTVSHHLGFISNVFNYAIRLDMLTDNPCKRVTLPREDKKEKEIYTLDEVKLIFEKLEQESPILRLFITLAAYSGFRRGELLGLEYKDIDWENNIVSIRRTSNYNVQFGTYTDTTKTEKSRRSLKLPKVVIDMITDYRAEQILEKAKLGDKWIETDRIFTNWCGEPLAPSNPYKWFHVFCEKNNIRFLNLHSFRHFHASALISNGVDIVAVSADLGHSEITTTGRTYLHQFQEFQARTCDVMANVLNFEQTKNKTA